MPQMPPCVWEMPPNAPRMTPQMPLPRRLRTANKRAAEALTINAAAAQEFTATSWLRSRLVDSGASLTQPWLETPKEFASRMQRDIRDINKEYDVEGLCHEFPQRLQDLSVKTCGDRLNK